MSNLIHSELKKSLKEASSLILNIVEDVRGNKSETRWDESHGLVLSIDHMDRKWDIEVQLHHSVKGKGEEVWSQIAVSNALDKAFHSVLNNGNIGQPGDDAQRISSAIVELETELKRALEKWELIFPVLGVNVGERIVFGNVELSKSNNKQSQSICERAKEILYESPHTEDEKNLYWQTIEPQIFRIFDSDAIASVSVEAAEKVAAKNIAYLSLLEKIDILNFFSITMYPQDMRVKVYLPNEARYTRRESLLFNQDALSLEMANEAPLQLLDLGRLTNQVSAVIGLDDMKAILAKGALSEIEKSIVNAARIAGKAHLSHRREDAFLLYAIAIESLVVGGDEKSDLTYKLSTRCAILLGKDLPTRIEIRDSIKRLYGIRSAIVHRGQSSFPDSDLSAIRRYSMKLIRKFLVSPELSALGKKLNLSAWFDEQILA